MYNSTALVGICTNKLGQLAQNLNVLTASVN